MKHVIYFKLFYKNIYLVFIMCIIQRDETKVYFLIIALYKLIWYALPFMQSNIACKIRLQKIKIKIKEIFRDN